MRRRFKQGSVTSTGYEETMLSRDVKRHLRVGDLLRLRGHVEAAVSEYEQARKVSASPTPEVSDRLGACLLDLGRTQETIELLEPIVRLYPSHSTTHIQLGRALAAEKRAFEAIRAFERANAINPFHPEVHCALTELHQDAGHPKDAERETEHCRLAAVYSGQNPEAEVKR
jgi:tetratricopeptide (TPR) repeat protein